MEAASNASAPAMTWTPLISSWSSTPIPNLSLSAGGLLALADLNTIAQRTVIKGGSSWLDVLVLAPGLHYQQAADALDSESIPGLSAELGLTAAIELSVDGSEARRHVINNIAMVNFLKRLWSNGETDHVVTLNVGLAKDNEEMDRWAKRLVLAMNRGSKAPFANDGFDLDWLSHVLYLMSPLLTICASTLMILLGDWWGLSFIVALMISRLLNIWIIKQRSQLPPKLRAPSTADASRPTEYTIDLGAHRKVIIRGLHADLQAVLTQVWLRNKTNLDGYLEATAKLIVYLVVAFSGNLSQAGALVLMALLLVSAGLLGLSNAHVRGLQMHGRVTRRDIGKLIEVVTLPDKESGRRQGLPVEDIRGR